MTDGDALVRELLPCPFCGARPHRGLGKIQHDQLHGEPFQRAWVRCPSGHASFDCMNEDMAITAWNNRTSTPQPKPLDPPAQDEVEVLREENARLRGALENAANAIDEMFRYFDGGETRGSYDGKPERAQLRKAGYAVRAALTGRQG